MKKLSLDALGRISAEEFEAKEKIPLILFADQIRSGHNIGAFFRIADAFALEGIVLSGFSPIPPHPEIEKTALGASQTVKWESCDNFEKYFQEKKKAGYKIIGAEQTDKSIRLHRYVIEPNGKYILVFGNEVSGIREEVLQYVEDCLEIPQFGTKHSINVSVAAGIMSWEFIKSLYLRR